VLTERLCLGGYVLTERLCLGGYMLTERLCLGYVLTELLCLGRYVLTERLCLEYQYATYQMYRFTQSFKSVVSLLINHALDFSLQNTVLCMKLLFPVA
jgi:hypothetical protein